MAKLLADYKLKLDQVLEDLSGALTDTKKEAAIQEAVVWHSRHEPQKKLQDLTGGGLTVEVAVATDFIEDFSTVRSIEYPQGKRPPEFLEKGEDYLLYKKPTGLFIQFQFTPDATKTARVTYTALHVVSASVGTIPDHRFDAVSNLAGALACQWLANRFSQQGDSTIGADSVDHKSKAEEFSRRAKELRQAYMDALGITELAGPPAASANADWDQGYPWGHDRLTHPRKGWDA